MTAQLPEMIKVGYQPVQIEVVDGMGFTGLMGAYHSSGNIKIDLSENPTPTEFKNTVLHEVLHACFNVSGLRADFKPAKEEKLVTVMANMLLQVIDENPEFIQWLMADLGETEEEPEEPKKPAKKAK